GLGRDHALKNRSSPTPHDETRTRPAEKRCKRRARSRDTSARVGGAV
ncbi:MAG: hypothetical protein AVDCRST_MAG86-212, partial [uncultured Truepera sp.]